MEAMYYARPNVASDVKGHHDLLAPGQGSELEACRQLSQTLGVSHRVRFPGQVSDMPVWYAACDVVVSASRIEG